jgi:hypothetical protein
VVAIYICIIPCHARYISINHSTKAPADSHHSVCVCVCVCVCVFVCVCVRLMGLRTPKRRALVAYVVNMEHQVSRDPSRETVATGRMVVDEGPCRNGACECWCGVV